MSNIYGYARVSTKTQRLDRQVENIINAYPEVKQIYTEKWTGTEVDHREEFQKLIKRVKTGDTIVFDSVSRMSRDADEGIKLYFALFDKGVHLVFLKERYIDTSVYAENMVDKIELTGADEDEIFKGLNNYFRKLAQRQIRIAFEQAEKEVKDLQKRVSEGMRATQKKNKGLPEEQQIQIGQRKGTKLTTKKSIEAKKIIKAKSKDFDGANNDIDCMKLTGLSRNTYYKYKRELMEEMQS